MGPAVGASVGDKVGCGDGGGTAVGAGVGDKVGCGDVGGPAAGTDVGDKVGCGDGCAETERTEGSALSKNTKFIVLVVGWFSLSFQRWIVVWYVLWWL
jgi:hypothetical protein